MIKKIIKKIRRILKKLISPSLRFHFNEWKIDKDLIKITNKLENNVYFQNWKIVPFEIDNKVFQINCYKYDRRIIAIFKRIQNPKIELLLKILKLNKFDTFVDIGANYGEFSIPISAHVKNTICIEPHPLVYRCLVENMKIYNNKLLLNCLITEKNGFEDFKFSLISSGGGNLFKKDNSYHKHFSIVKDRSLLMQHKSITAEDILSDEIQRNKVIMIKIDIEGLDLMICKKICTLLKNYKQKFLIMFEYNNLSKNEIGDKHLDNLLMDIKENKNKCFILTNEHMRQKKLITEKIDLIKGQQLPSGEIIISNFQI